MDVDSLPLSPFNRDVLFYRRQNVGTRVHGEGPLGSGLAVEEGYERGFLL